MGRSSCRRKRAQTTQRFPRADGEDCKGGAWKGESVWHCSDGKTKRAAIEGAKAGRKKETESRSPVIAGGLVKAFSAVMI